MSANENNKDSAAESPATAAQNPAAAKKPAAPKQVSRLYARMRRDKVGAPPPASASLSSEPVTQIDNLPVRATAPAHLVGDGAPPRDDRPERSERREYSDRSDRGDRGRRGGRDDRGERRERGGRDDRGRGRRRSDDRSSQEDRPPQTTWEAPAEEIEARTPYEPAEEEIGSTEIEANVELESNEEVPNDDESSTRRRGPRFESADEGDNDRSHLIQEFKPSRHAERARASTPKNVAAGKKGSLMGWIKSVFTGSEEKTETPERPSSPSRERRSGSGGGRGSRSRGQGGRGPNADSSSGRTDGEDRPRRRRRRRSGGSGGGEGGSGGGRGRGRGRDGRSGGGSRGPRREG